jgi:hypothetical protein
VPGGVHQRPFAGLAAHPDPAASFHSANDSLLRMFNHDIPIACDAVDGLTLRQVC